MQYMKFKKSEWYNRNTLCVRADNICEAIALWRKGYRRIDSIWCGDIMMFMRPEHCIYSSYGYTPFKKF